MEHVSNNLCIVMASELGSNCWLAIRFVKNGGRCDHIYSCKYLEKKTCQAVHAEIAYLKQRQMQLPNVSTWLGHKIETLTEMLEK